MADFLQTIGAKIAAVISGVVLLLTGAVSGNIHVPHSGSSESQAAGAAVAVAGTNQLAQTQPGAAGNATSQDATTTVVNYITQPVVERVVESDGALRLFVHFASFSKCFLNCFLRWISAFDSRRIIPPCFALTATSGSPRRSMSIASSNRASA